MICFKSKEDKDFFNFNKSSLRKECAKKIKTVRKDENIPF